MAHSKHDSIRRWYGLCCGYCGVSEADSGGELTVDHFRPVSQGGDDSDANLVYCCFRCNLNKGDFFPTPDDAAHGRRLLHPLLDDMRVHLHEETDGTVSGLSAAGRFHIHRLRLNRPQLIERRLTKRDQALQQERTTRLEEMLADRDALVEELGGMAERFRKSE